MSGLMIAAILLFGVGMTLGAFSGVHLDDFLLILGTAILVITLIATFIAARALSLWILLLFLFWGGFAGIQYLL